MNHFTIFSRGLYMPMYVKRQEHRPTDLFEFEFDTYEEFLANPEIKRIIDSHSDFHQVSIMHDTRRIMNIEKGKASNINFYTVMFERSKGRIWNVFGKLKGDVEGFPVWRPVGEI